MPTPGTFSGETQNRGTGHIEELTRLKHVIKPIRGGKQNKFDMISSNFSSLVRTNENCIKCIGIHL